MRPLDERVNFHLIFFLVAPPFSGDRRITLFEGIHKTLGAFFYYVYFYSRNLSLQGGTRGHPSFSWELPGECLLYIRSLLE